MKKIVGVLILISILMAQCGKDDPVDDNNNNNTPPVSKGDLEVFVHLDKATGALWGGALVNVYKTSEDRDSGNVYRYNYTASQVPYSAYIDTLEVQKWYIRATFFYQGKDYLGDGEAFVPKDAKTSYHLTATPK